MDPSNVLECGAGSSVSYTLGSWSRPGVAVRSQCTHFYAVADCSRCIRGKDSLILSPSELANDHVFMHCPVRLAFRRSSLYARYVHFKSSYTAELFTTSRSWTHSRPSGRRDVVHIHLIRPYNPARHTSMDHSGLAHLLRCSQLTSIAALLSAAGKGKAAVAGTPPNWKGADAAAGLSAAPLLCVRRMA